MSMISGSAQSRPGHCQCRAWGVENKMLLWNENTTRAENVINLCLTAEGSVRRMTGSLRVSYVTSSIWLIGRKVYRILEHWRKTQMDLSNKHHIPHLSLHQVLLSTIRVFPKKSFKKLRSWKQNVIVDWELRSIQPTIHSDERSLLI